MCPCLRLILDGEQVLFEPSDARKEKRILEVECFGQRSREVIEDIMKYFMGTFRLNILKAVVDEPGSDVDFCVFYCSRETPIEHQKAPQPTTATVGDGGVPTEGAVRGRPVPPITEEEMDQIRDGIRQIYASKGLAGGEALVRLVHSSEMIYSFNSKTMVSKRKQRATHRADSGESDTAGYHAINIKFDREDSARSLESDYSLELGGSAQSGGVIHSDDLSCIV